MMREGDTCEVGSAMMREGGLRCQEDRDVSRICIGIMHD
jgi:hypothetical protein